MNGNESTLIRPANGYNSTSLFRNNDFSTLRAIKGIDSIFPNNYGFWPPSFVAQIGKQNQDVRASAISDQFDNNTCSSAPCRELS